MGIFDKLFQGEEPSLPQHWQPLTDVNQLPSILQGSSEKPVAFFKHSIRCGTSSMVKNQLERTYDLEAASVDFYFLDLINYRSISNAIADQLNVRHESPQLILVKDGKAVYHASHHWIDLEAMKAAL